MDLKEELLNVLYNKGAKLVGIGDMKCIVSCQYDVGVSVAIPVPKKIIYELQDAPTREYYDIYYKMNATLNEIVTAGEAFLQERGYHAYAQTTDRVKVNTERYTEVPHKTVATRAGLGWIGKNCLLVTSEYGSAIRLSSLLTDAPLQCDKPMEKSLCGACNVCVNNCPAQALKGTLWDAGMERDKIVDVEQCYQKEIEIMFEKTGIKRDLCGKCFATCTYTRKYLNSSED